MKSKYRIFMLYLMFFFFFKQKTAYEMRISDWSSDVCSSDLANPAYASRYNVYMWEIEHVGDTVDGVVVMATAGRIVSGSGPNALRSYGAPVCSAGQGFGTGQVPDPTRSEEHTSELQSLMRISYAVFCLKKKKKKTTQY